MPVAFSHHIRIQIGDEIADSGGVTGALYLFRAELIGVWLRKERECK
jgi:hypothetical protein